jgi:hypothetical protein
LSGSEPHHLSPKLERLSAASLSQIGREEKAAAADEVSPIVRHRASMVRLKVIAVARRWVSPRPTHPTGLAGLAAFWAVFGMVLAGFDHWVAVRTIVHQWY